MDMSVDNDGNIVVFMHNILIVARQLTDFC